MPRKPRKPSSQPAHHTGPSIPRARPSVNPLKRRIRDLDRLLAGPKADALPADVRVGYERELAGARGELEDAERVVERERMVKRYHMVRFFERKKAMRNLKKAKARLARAQEGGDAAEAAVEELRDEVHRCDVDVQYTMFFPLDKKYSSLYNTKDEDHSGGSGLDDSHSANSPSTQTIKAARDHPMWKAVEQAMAAGTLKQLREGKLIDEQTGEMVTVAKKNNEKTQRQKNSRGKQSRNATLDDRPSASDDDETGGAFFE